MTSKVLLAEWAATRAVVVKALNEIWLPGRERRADVHILFDNGRRVVLEVQGLHDELQPHPFQLSELALEQTGILTPGTTRARISACSPGPRGGEPHIRSDRVRSRQAETGPSDGPDQLSLFE
ncbi:hypothetical protein H0264_25455 [Nocardia huaxiensis]|uniref:Uncharacterized protein n=1 Tax=Nocardia huaxiensis TaxID=2755382 RepID=A0A7D6ZEZ0_9NOCA|nr:hypothetical protein [Nocardia huaxiensis]QLY28667.1 hypothetical protein H0264_25455 [Nocardia huaxiensis]